MSKLLAIPPRPDLLIELQLLIQSKEPNLDSLARLIKKEVALYSILLSIVNSPIYRRNNQINSIEQAIALLGINKVFTLIQSIIVRSSLETTEPLENFWASATEVANICGMIAEQFIIIDSDVAYSLGMLHAAGIPLMMQKFPEYHTFHQQNIGLCANKLCFLEREQFATDHYHQGYELTKHWHLDENVSLSLRYQPISQAVIKDPKHLPAEVPILLALLKIAKAVSAEYCRYWQQDGDEQSIWQSIKCSLEFLHISHDDFCDLREQISQRFMQASVVSRSA